MRDGASKRIIILFCPEVRGRGLRSSGKKNGDRWAEISRSGHRQAKPSHLTWLLVLVLGGKEQVTGIAQSESPEP
jgi:hypothetical protein